MTRVYWDSMLFIYLFEDHPEFADRVQFLAREIARRGHAISTSVFTVGEVLTGFYKRDQGEAIPGILDRFGRPGIELLPFTGGTANRFARIRARHRVSPGDAIHLATAAEARANLFLTNDRKLSSLVVDDVDFIAGLDVNLY